VDVTCVQGTFRVGALGDGTCIAVARVLLPLPLPPPPPPPPSPPLLSAEYCSRLQLLRPTHTHTHVLARRDFFKSIFAALPSCVMHCRVPALLGFAAAAFVCVHAQAIMSQYDVLVYGSTPGGIQAAIAASTEGASVLLVSPSARIGGMMSSGLGHTDKGNATAIGGAALKFFQDICPGSTSHPPPPCWDFPPSHALALFQRMLAAAPNVTVIFLYSVAAVTRDGTVTTSVTLNPIPSTHHRAPLPPPLSPLIITAAYFVDCSYEGDLLHAAGAPMQTSCSYSPRLLPLSSPTLTLKLTAVSTTIGREPQSQYAPMPLLKRNSCVTLLLMYNESHAGVQYEPSPYGSHQARCPTLLPTNLMPHNLTRHPVPPRHQSFLAKWQPAAAHQQRRRSARRLRRQQGPSVQLQARNSTAHFCTAL